MTLASTVLVAVLAADGAAPETDLQRETEAWYVQRKANLLSSTGWLAYIGWLPLEEGVNTAGSAKGNTIRLAPSFPEQLGTFTCSADSIAFAPATGVSVAMDGKPFTGGTLRTYAEGKPVVVTVGTASFYASRNQGKCGVRCYDSETPVRKAFKELARFPVNPLARVEARFDPEAGIASFTFKGKEYRLEGMVDDDQIFFVFGDATNGKETYGGGRFLYTPLPADGRVVLDFNRAENPPCVFTPASKGCPIPSKANRLPVRMEAGELRYPG